MTTMWLSIRFLARFKAEGEGCGLQPIPTTKNLLAETVHQLSRGHLTELVLDLSSSHLLKTHRVHTSRGHWARLEVAENLVALVVIEGIANVRQTLRVGGA